MSKKGENDEKELYIAEKAQIDEKWKKSYLWNFFRKMWNNVKKVKNDEKMSYIAERGLN